MNDYDVDLVMEARADIRDQVRRNVLARELGRTARRGGWLVSRIDPLLVRLGDRARARQAHRQEARPAAIPRGSQPQGR